MLFPLAPITERTGAEPTNLLFIMGLHLVCWSIATSPGGIALVLEFASVTLFTLRTRGYGAPRVAPTPLGKKG